MNCLVLTRLKVPLVVGVSLGFLVVGLPNDSLFVGKTRYASKRSVISSVPETPKTCYGLGS